MDEKLAARRFWDWLRRNQHRLDRLQTSNQPFWGEILERLHKVRPDFGFEVSDVSEDPREFIITAQGHAPSFAGVDGLTAEAPVLPGWRVVPLKPARGFEFAVNYEGMRLDPRDMWFLPLNHPELPRALGLRVAVPDITSADIDTVTNAVLVILDTAIGERSAAPAAT